MITIGLGGDLMIGRLVDQSLDHHPPSYVWGNLLPVLARMDLNIVNLETTLTTSRNIVPKVFNFRARPSRISVLTEGHIHAVNVANNHILDFSEEGLEETLHTLDRAKIQHVGAGCDLTKAKQPAILEKKGIKIGLLGCSDNEPDWKAEENRPGIYYVRIGDMAALEESIVTLRETVDLLILSIHWGPNMRRRPPSHFRTFAHDLIDLGVDILHGHSAHVFQGVEIYNQKLILYDTGDLVDDYAVDPVLRNDLSFWFAVRADTHRLLSLEMIPTVITNFQVNRCSGADGTESIETMKELCHELRTHPREEDGRLFLSLDA